MGHSHTPKGHHRRGGEVGTQFEPAEREEKGSPISSLFGGTRGQIVSLNNNKRNGSIRLVRNKVASEKGRVK